MLSRVKQPSRSAAAGHRRPRILLSAGRCVVHGSYTPSQQTVASSCWSELLPAFLAADSEQEAAVSSPAGAAELEDSITLALWQMEAAVETENYETAAQLRDSALPWLGGWWRPQLAASNSSFLLHVAHTEANRWTGLLFTPADFMHFDLMANCTSSELQMADMLQDARYGTPLFEVFVLPNQQEHQHQQQQGMTDLETEQATATAAGSISKQDPSTSSSNHDGDCGPAGFTPVVVALQSANRAFNELLGVTAQQTRRRRPVEPDEARYINQRVLLLVQPHGITAAAVHAGCHSTLCTWQAPLHTNSSSKNSSGSQAADSSGSQAADSSSKPHSTPASAGADAGAAVAESAGMSHAAAASAVEGPVYPAEGLSGGCRRGLTVDGTDIDFLRGPATLQRTAPDSFTFARQALPADVLSTFTSSSSSTWDSSSARLFRVDLQYRLPPAWTQIEELHELPAELREAQAEAEAEAAAAASADSSDQSDDAAGGMPDPGSSSDAAGPAAATANPSWAGRAAAELCSLLAGSTEQHADITTAAAGTSDSSSSSSNLHHTLQALLTAAAVGTAPPRGVVSEEEQVVTVVEVPLGAGAAAAGDSDTGSDAAAGGGGAGPAAAMPAAASFTRVLEPTASLSFGGWKVTARL